MANSQNGWPVVGRDKINESPINGHRYPNGFLAGDVYEAFTWLFTQLDKRVEKVSRGTPADEWGYYVKNIEGTSRISNHASGTAGDYNATLHPMGVRNTYGATQRAEIAKILKEAKGIFRWGGNYTGRPDDMHFEIDKDARAVAAFVTGIRPQRNYLLDIKLNDFYLPTLHLGDSDTSRGGYNYVIRAQAMLKLLVEPDLLIDGYYQKKTQEVVAKLGSKGDGTVIGLPQWTLLYGFQRLTTPKGK